ncbi:unnamed protein product [Vitrella brassicaformis CCMP3155]|uniref:Protein kinase domain-containing protein n=1 Tax=Vitrella brassicaformis (strain CCMP3155) TaxID=1169540 RepID=A0A0G4EHN6_VITBC|nr:unnamed protein product [Vitrella brassicaformis CCMP3155]|eukprot:CEL95700.1 unnamed protein product [Vitrella brassicaformis CCMP3155]
MAAGIGALIIRARRREGPQEGKEVALRMRPKREIREGEGEADFMEEVQNEIRALEGARDLDGVINLHAAYHFAYITYLEMELLSAERPLSRLASRHLDSEGRSVLSETQAVEWMAPVADTYAKLLERGIDHGDLHLDNIQYDHQGQAKLIDVEQAQLYDPQHTRLLSTGPNPKGVRYFQASRSAAPHTYSPHRLFDPDKATVYAVGRMVRMLLEYGHDPATLDPLSAPFGPSPLRRNVSPTAADLINRTTAMSPSARPTMAEVLAHPWFRQGAVAPPYATPTQLPHHPSALS